jgi:hypothetical protein
MRRTTGGAVIAVTAFFYLKAHASGAVARSAREDDT